MFHQDLSQAVENFCRLFLNVPDAELERHWVWKDHDEEGIRFAFFVTLQELRQLAVKLAPGRVPPTPAQHILSQYHAAYLDAQAAILGLSAVDSERAPAEGEWPVRRVYAHILGTDVGFGATVRYALERHRAGSWTPDPLPAEEEQRIVGISPEEYQTLVEGPLEGMLTFHRSYHPKLVAEFATITAAELDLPATFWEETRFPIRHRLHRFEAHYAQHTIQIDKTLAAIDLAPNETRRLTRKVYAALAEAEAQMIGVDKFLPECEDLAQIINQRTREIAAILK